MPHTEIAWANERAVIADMLINVLTNVRLTYLSDLEPADAHELLLIGAHVLIAQLGSQLTTAAEVGRVIWSTARPCHASAGGVDRPRLRRAQRNRYKMTAKLNVPHLQRHMRSNISVIQAAAKQLGHP